MDVFEGDQPTGVSCWDWGPTPALADQVIYSETETADGSHFRQLEAGAAHPGKLLLRFDDLSYQLPADVQWLPDGSGFLWSYGRPFSPSANLFRHDFASRKTTNLTNYDDAFAGRFSISPDGRWVVYERLPAADEPLKADLWLIGADGQGDRLLVKGGQDPAWSRVTHTAP
jgi:Tol biopolymer transport system component